MPDIFLDGAEITIIKALGFSGGDISGSELIERTGGLDEAEFLDALKGLVVMGYVFSETTRFSSMEHVEKSRFHVNSGYVKELKEAMDPKPKQKVSKRVRRA